MAIPLVVGIDGSEVSLEAVNWTADEAVRYNVPLHLMHAAAPGHDAADLIAAASERARKAAPTVRLSGKVLHEDAASALVSEGRNAIALVVGSRGLGDLGLLLGSVSLAVAAHADCPVVVVRGAAEYRDALFGSVVGVEDGEGSGTAVQFAFREAHVRHCRLVAVHAWSAPIGACSEPPPPSGFALEAHRRPADAGARRRAAWPGRAVPGHPGEPPGDRGVDTAGALGGRVRRRSARRRSPQAAWAPRSATGLDQPRGTASRTVFDRGRSADMTSTGWGTQPVGSWSVGPEWPPTRDLRPCNRGRLPLDRGGLTDQQQLEAEHG